MGKGVCVGGLFHQQAHRNNSRKYLEAFNYGTSKRGKKKPTKKQKKKKPDTLGASINFARLCSLFLGRLQCGGKNEQMRMSS